MSSSSKFKTGLGFGILSGIAGIAVLVIRYVWFGSTPVQLSLATAIGFVIMVLFLFGAAAARKKQLGGFADVKELFGTLFVVILITELCFSVFNYAYLQYIDPGYLTRFGQSTLSWMQAQKMAPERIEEYKKALEAQQHVSFGTLAFGFARAVIVDSIIGIVIAFIMKKSRPVTL